MMLQGTESKAQDRRELLEPLPVDFQPGATEIVCVRGRLGAKHCGNVNFVRTAKRYLNEYAESSSKADKSCIVSEIVAVLREESPFGGFVKKIGDRYFVANDQTAREKVSQCLRNLLHGKYKSSNKAKKIQRQLRETMFDEEVDLALSKMKCEDLFKKVERLTAQAKTDNDFQMAFNQANMELLRNLKSLPTPTLPSLSFVDTDEPEHIESADLEEPISITSSAMPVLLSSSC